MDTLQNKIIVVTGAGGTIAGPVEEALVARGARPILVDRDIVTIESRARSYATQPIESDLMTADAAAAMVRAAKEQMGRIDGLIHLVGDVVMGDVDLLDAESYGVAFDTNVKTLFHTVQAVLPELREREEAFLGGISARTRGWTCSGRSSARTQRGRARRRSPCARHLPRRRTARSA
jgi:NADP-dependent 3-hydroxy acid dehydrogenase YdfG